MESKKINQLATELAPDLSDLTIIGDPTTGISKKITLSQMASLFTGTVEEYANLAAFPLVGVADTIYIALDTNVLYRWDTGLTSYVELSPNIINSLVFSDANGFDGNISLVGSVATLTITTALTTGSVPFIGASGALSQDNSNLFFDDTNNRLGINTNAPTTALDVFGSGIIGRLNGTSTNNSFLGFASAGTNKWSIGNVQSDHRFRIYNEATTSELVSVLSTGEFGIGIANPTTKVHIDGAASALIANLDANVSVAKSISFRSDNSARINLEVSGTESGSNAGADLFIRRYSDAGSLIDTPLTITRSTGALTFSGITTISNATTSTNTTTGALVVTGGVGIGGALFGTSATFSGNVTAAGLIGTGLYSNSWYAGSGSTLSLRTAASAVIADFSPTSSNILGKVGINGSTAPAAALTIYDQTSGSEQLRLCNSSGTGYWGIGRENNITGDLYFNSGGTFRVAFKANGNVLIGSSTDRSFKLVVEGTDNNNLMGSYNTTSGASLRMQSNQTINYIVSATNQLQFEVGAAIRMLMTTAGDIYMGSTTTDKNSRLVLYGNSTTSAAFALRCYSVGSDVLFGVRNDGAIYTGTVTSAPYNLAVTGRDLYVENSGVIGYLSSVRKSKINIKNIENADWLLKLNPVSFNKRKKDDEGNYTDKFYNELDYGLIAEEAELINDEICFYDETEEGKIIRGVSYTKLITPMLKMIQIHQAQIEELKALINK